jgi:hypothetical protein
MPAQLDDGCQFAAFKVGAADGFSGRFVDDNTNCSWAGVAIRARRPRHNGLMTE